MQARARTGPGATALYHLKPAKCGDVVPRLQPAATRGADGEKRAMAMEGRWRKDYA
jgi:hypothetical protein